MEAIKNRYEFVMFFDVENGNPNGDPDAGNMPRIDPETSYGIVTDVCLKRKIRNFVDIAKGSDEGYKILINPGCALNTKFKDAYEDLGLPIGEKGKNKNNVTVARDFLCANYYDVRTFGAVMNTGDDPAGIVRGPVQLTFARSIDEVYPMELSITRQVQATEADRDKKGENTIGKKNIIPYGLYRADGFVSAMLAQKTGFSESDLELFWQAIINMFEHDRSAARGKMTLRKLFVFKHSDILGDCPANVLLESVNAEKKEGVIYPRKFADYVINRDKNIPDSVECIEMV